MHTVGIVARVVLGLAFVAAGVFKLVEGPNWPRQAADLGVARPVASAVPVVEIVVGALVAAQVAPPIPTAAAMLMLIMFTCVILLRLADGSRPPCACFGSRSNRPLGAGHLVRNAMLGVVAVLALF